MVRVRRLRRAYNAVSANAEDDTASTNNNNSNNELEEDVEEFVDEEEGTVETTTSSTMSNATPSSSLRSTTGRRRRQYQTLRTDDDDGADEDDDDDDETNKDVSNTTTEEEDDEDEEKGTKVTVVVLDPAQKKFLVQAYTHWTIAYFKEKGETVHKVTPPSQRLIYRGQLLQDNKTLEQSGLVRDNLIVHLFPRPRVIIQQKKESSCSAAGQDDNDDDDTEAGNNNNNNSGAHIPQIVLNPDEAEQRATILVLGSADFLEAQNNVKLFSFLLLVISSIELFNLILILLGVPPDNGSGNTYASSEDDIFHIDVNTTEDYATTYGYHNNNHNSNNNNYDRNNDPYAHPDPYEQEQIQQEMQTWHPRNNVDMIVSAVGVYVAMLGIRATNETTLRLARQYLVGTAIVGVAWMMYNYWFTVHVDQEFDQLRRDERHNHTLAPSSSSSSNNGTTQAPIHYDDDVIPYKTQWEYYQQNLSLMMIPGMVWILCCIRAWQFQTLLEEAEREAEERIRNELAQHQVTPAPTTATVATTTNSTTSGDETVVSVATDEEAGGRRHRQGRLSHDDTDLELQNNAAVMT